VKIESMNTKTKALALLSVILVAAAVASLFYALQATAAADTSVAVAADEQAVSAPTGKVQGDQSQFNMQTGPPMEGRFGGGPRGMMRGHGGFGGFGAMQVSSEFTANVTAIANRDSDVQNLISQGYNITFVRPQISTVVDGNGNVVTKASTAQVMLVGNSGSHAIVTVDLSQAKVTKIVTFTVTEINK
jgi:hypothetical protein